MKCYNVKFNHYAPMNKRGEFVATMQGINPSDALLNWNNGRVAGERLKMFYLMFVEV